jgi:archaetidylinositol phosphate synthase
MSKPINRCADPFDFFCSATRIQKSFVANVEKRALTWLAKRTPAWVKPDHLTGLGFVSQCMVGICYALSRLNPDILVLSVVWLALNWLGDSLDGTLARVRDRQRPRYGFYVDHIADTVAAIFLMTGLAVSGCIRPSISFGMLIAFLAVSIESYLATYTLGRFRLSYWKFGPTEIRILLAMGNLALIHHSTIRILSKQVRLFDLGGVISILGMGMMLIVSAITHIKELYDEERFS